MLCDPSLTLGVVGSGVFLDCDDDGVVLLLYDSVVVLAVGVVVMRFAPTNTGKQPKSWKKKLKFEL